MLQDSGGDLHLRWRAQTIERKLVCSDRFDHTSMLRFLETRFGAEVPNLSRWRRSVTGDLTTAFNSAARASPAPPPPAGG